jgi:hypothetical protein
MVAVGILLLTNLEAFTANENGWSIVVNLIDKYLDKAA